MRYVVIGFCVFAAACSGASPTAPTLSAPTSSTATFSSSQRVTTNSEGASKLPFKGTYEGLETVDPVSGHHHLEDVTGNATHLGQFTVTAEWTLGPTGGSGTSTCTPYIRNRTTMYLALIGDVPASSGHELPFSQPTYDSHCYFVWFHRSFGKGSVSEQAIERAPRRASNVSSAAARSCPG